ncbi:MAG: helix-turn-helix domain-containing protein [Sphingomonadales bacterium]
MKVDGHGDEKYATGRRLREPADWSSMRVELWNHRPGLQAELTLPFTEIAVMLSGHSTVSRIGDGKRQVQHGKPGTVWICPAGTHESNVEVSTDIDECLHIFLPPALIEHAALEDHDIDPNKVELAYTSDLADPLLSQISSTFRALLDRPAQSTDRLLVDGMRTALAAHILATYSADRWVLPVKAPSMDAKRLARVLDFVEARLAAEISLDDLAAEACLSPFHFSRQFGEAMGTSPHRYVTERRVEAAKRKLELESSAMIEIALDTGFGSQANFNRVFRKVTGLTPGQYRDMRMR